MSDAPHGPLVFGVDDGGGAPAPGTPDVYGSLHRVVPTPPGPFAPGVWVPIPFDTPGPANGIAQLGAPLMELGVGPEGADYLLTWKVSTAITAFALTNDNIRIVPSVNGSPLVGAEVVTASAWHDVLFDLLAPFSPMFTLSGSTMVTLFDGDTVGLYAFLTGGPPLTAILRDASLNLLKLQVPPPV